MKAGRAPLIFLLVLAAIALAVVTWNQYRELIGLRAAELTFAAPGDDARRLAELNGRLDRLRQRLEAVTAREKKAADAAAATTGKAAWNETPEAKHWIGIIRDYRISQAIDQFYGALFKKLNLSPEQLAQFKNLVTEKKLAVLDAFNAAREQGLAPNSPTVKAAIVQASGSVDGEIEQALGPAAYAEFQQYDATLPERNAVTLVEQHLGASGASLSDEQAEQLIQIFAANRPAALNQNLGYVLGSATGWISVNDVQAAAAALTPEQLSGVQAAREQQRAQQQLQQILYQQQHPPPGGKG